MHEWVRCAGKIILPENAEEQNKSNRFNPAGATTFGLPDLNLIFAAWAYLLKILNLTGKF